MRSLWSRPVLALALATLCVTNGWADQLSSSGGVTLQDEGTSQGRVQRLNCTGSGVTCSASGSTGTINVTAGGGSLTISTTEIDFGTDAKFVAKATVTDAGVSGTSKILVWQSGEAATGRQSDENEMDGITCNAKNGSGSFTLRCQANRSVTHGKYQVYYTVQ